MKAADVAVDGRGKQRIRIFCAYRCKTGMRE